MQLQPICLHTLAYRTLRPGAPWARRPPSLRACGALAPHSPPNGQVTNPQNNLVSLLSKMGHRICHATLKEVGSSSTLACPPITLAYHQDTLAMGMDQGDPTKG